VERRRQRSRAELDARSVSGAMSGVTNAQAVRGGLVPQSNAKAFIRRRSLATSFWYPTRLPAGLLRLFKGWGGRWCLVDFFCFANDCRYLVDEEAERLVVVEVGVAVAVIQVFPGLSA
jgi:hypothetical protein